MPLPPSAYTFTAPSFALLHEIFVTSTLAVSSSGSFISTPFLMLQPNLSVTTTLYMPLFSHKILKLVFWLEIGVETTPEGSSKV